MAGNGNGFEEIAVIGAGIVGIATALHLQRDGRKVSLYDPDAPGQGCSFGNCGAICIGSMIPVATPGILGQVPGMLMDRQSPLSIDWRYLPRLAPWLWKFVQASRPDRVEANSIALNNMLTDAYEAYQPLLQSAGAVDMFRRVGLLYVYRSEASFIASRWGHEMRVRRGVRVEYLNGDEVAQLEPALAPVFSHGVFIPDSGHVINPGRLSTVLAEDFVRNGGTIRRERVQSFTEFTDDGPRTLISDAGMRSFSQVVITAGAYSRPLARALGSDVPLDTERGYHAMLETPGVELRVPLMSGEGKFGITPMEHGLRLAGTVELAGLHAPPNWKRAETLIEQTRPMFRALATDKVKLWMGRRPSMPDSLPVIGRSPKHRNAWFAFGHGHLGLSLGAATGRLVADLMAARKPAVDPTPYRADRF